MYTSLPIVTVPLLVWPLTYSVLVSCARIFTLADRHTLSPIVISQGNNPLNRTTNTTIDRVSVNAVADENLIKENRELDINNIELVGQTLEDEIGNNPKEETPIPVDDSISVLSSDLAEQLGDLADIQSDMADFINQGRNDSGIINC